MEATNLTPEIAIIFFAVFFLGMCLIKLIFSLPRRQYNFEGEANYADGSQEQHGSWENGEAE